MNRPPPRRSPLRPALGALAGLLLGAAALLAPARAAAFERQWHVGANLGYSALMGSDPTRHGLGGGLHLTYGLTDAFNLMAEVDVSSHFGRAALPPPTGGMMPPENPGPFPGLLIASGAVGAGYVFDVLQWVPYVGAIAGAADLVDVSGKCGGNAPCNSFRLNLAIPFGLDYNVSRSFAVGVGGRFQLLVGSQLNEMLTGFLRAEYVWGY